MRVLKPTVQSNDGPAPFGRNMAPATKAAMFDSPGLRVHLRGDVLPGGSAR